MHILIIEDDGDFRREMTDFLENSLYRVTAPDEFGQIVPRIQNVCPDIILLDLNLPGQSGFDICTEIRKVSDIPIIFVTGRTDSMDEVTALLKGGDDYITKPFHPSLLLAHIGAVLKRTKKGTEELKMEYGKRLLKNTRLMVREISEYLGFCDEHYFSYLFKQKTGNSPLTYRAAPEGGVPGSG